jgi:hypothetical protein
MKPYWGNVPTSTEFKEPGSLAADEVELKAGYATKYIEGSPDHYEYVCITQGQTSIIRYIEGYSEGSVRVTI